MYIKHVHLCFLVRSSVKNHKGRIEGGKKEKVGGRWGRRREEGGEGGGREGLRKGRQEGEAHRDRE